MSISIKRGFGLNTQIFRACIFSALYKENKRTYRHHIPLVRIRISSPLVVCTKTFIVFIGTVFYKIFSFFAKSFLVSRLFSIST